MKNMKFIFAFLFAILLISCNKKEKQVQVNKLPYPVVKVGQKDVQTFYTFPSNIAGINNNQVRPKITGYIKEVLIDEGQHVNKGQVLFKLETNIQDQNASAAKDQISSANANIEAAKAQVKAAQVEVDKLMPLVEKNIISPIQLETARANLMRAKGVLSQAQAGYSSAKADYQAINENIKFSIITSPIDGVIGKFNSRVGALVSPQDPNPITTVSDVNEVYAYFTLNEKQYIYFFQNFPGKTLEEKLTLVPPIELELADGSIYEEPGKLEASTGVMDPNTGTIQFRVKFNNKNGLLTNGSTGKIRIPRTYKDVLVIPESATFEQQGIIYTYKVQADSVVSTVITSRDRVNKLVVIEKGLEKGDQIVAQGTANLRNGTKIIPKEVQLDSILTISKIK